MHLVTVDAWRHIKAGDRVDDGFGGYCTAPATPGLYTLYEKVEGNTHTGWKWEKEAEV